MRERHFTPDSQEAPSAPATPGAPDKNIAQAHATLTAAYPGLDFTFSERGMSYTNLVTPPLD